MTRDTSIHMTRVNDTELAYIDEGQGPAVLLIHGFCGSSSYWEHIIPMLSKANRVIAPDLRGHGSSSAGKVTSTMELLADDIAALLTHLRLDQVTVFGHSLGGYVALALVERHAHLVQKLSLVHSTALPDSEEAKLKRTQGVNAIREQGIIPYVDGLIPKLFAEAHLSKMPDKVLSAIELGYLTSPAGAIDSLVGMQIRNDRNHVLRDHHIPTLLIAGSEDLIIPAERAFTVTASHIKHVIIEEVGHMSMIESPDRLFAIMNSFLTN